LGFLYFEPQSFMIGIRHTLLPYVSENSFPSDHGILIWALGMGLIATGTAQRCGALACLYGAGVAWVVRPSWTSRLT